jgi:coenzyme F420-reducing hydrogenase gamma subunit
VRRGINEIVDVVETSNEKYAKQYFQLKKQMDNESFVNLYDVVKVDIDDRDRPTRF